MSLEHAHARVSEFLEAFCAQVDTTPPYGDTDSVSFLDSHVLTATDLRTLLTATAPITPVTLAERFERLEPWAKRALAAMILLRAEQEAEARAVEQGLPTGDRTVFWRGPGQERHYLPAGTPVTFLLSPPPVPPPALPAAADPPDPPDPDGGQEPEPEPEPEPDLHEVRVQAIPNSCLLVTTPTLTRILAVNPMSHRAICITAELAPTAHALTHDHDHEGTSA